MKPSWEDSPSWANYRAMDDDRRWYWYEIKPKVSKVIDAFTECGGRYEEAKEENNWKKSLQQRPEK